MKNFGYGLKQFGKMLCYVLLYYGVLNLVGIVAVAVYTAVHTAQIAAENNGQISNAAMYELSMKAQDFLIANESWITVAALAITLLFLWIFFKVRKKKLLSEIQLRPVSARLLLPILLCGVGLWLVIEFGMGLLPIPEAMWEAYGQSAEVLVAGSTLATILGYVIAAPIIEEIIFRGLALSRLRKAMPAWAAALICSLVFGLLHGQILWIAYAFVLGMLFSFLALRTNSIAASIFAHMLFNFLGTIVSLWLPEEIAMPIYIVALVVGFALTAVGIWRIVKETREA